MIPVDLFGQSADHDAIAEVAKDEGLFVLDDAAQSFGATYKGRRLGTFGLATATSFFPAKPLGCFGDGGAIFTDDADLAERLRSVRVHGQGTEKYDNVRLGLTARLDTMQAAILIEKLKIFQDEIEARNKVASRYFDALHNIVIAPRVADGNVSTWAQYTIRLPRGGRDAFAESLKAQGIPTAIYYPKSMASADGLQALSDRRGRAAGQRETVRGRHQPADARLSRSGRAGSRHQGCARRSFVAISTFCPAVSCYRSSGCSGEFSPSAATRFSRESRASRATSCSRRSLVPVPWPTPFCGVAASQSLPGDFC